MIQIPILKRAAVERLWKELKSNKDHYESDFEVDGRLIKEGELLSVPDCELDPNIGSMLVLPGSDRTPGEADAENALILFQELKGLTPKIARDERVWVALCHLYAREFIAKRHLQVSEDHIQRAIQTRFFCRVSGSGRGFERDNALSRLWWWGYISKGVVTMNHATAVKALLELTDFRDAFVGRSTISMIPQVFEAILCVYIKEKNIDPGVSFFRRKSRGADSNNYLTLAKLIHRHGGRMLYDTMSVGELTDFFWELRESIR